ncbi:putative ABC transporter [Astrocystis sublimbata]|nr:putative ABC transporter [Astrocystis sublimbata]
MDLHAADDTFGPQYRSQFDFTLVFEQVFFQIVPCGLLLLVLPWRISQLRRQQPKTSRTAASSLKYAAAGFLAATQLALLVAWAVSPASVRTRTALPAAALSFLASTSLIYISSLEHARSVRPSSTIGFYILLSLVLDAAQARTLWIRPIPRFLPAVFTAGLVAKIVVCYVEARSKKLALLPPYRQLSPEDLAGLYSRTILWWINPMFWVGYKGTLSFESLYSIDSDLSSSQLEHDFTERWEKRSGSSKSPLLWAIAKTTHRTFFAMVIPRLFLSALRLSQPLFIHRVTGYLDNLRNERAETGRGLIGAAVLIYLGLAVSTTLYKRNLHRLIAMVRGILLTAIQTHALTLPAERVSDNAALTLISTDVNRIGNSLLHLDNTFAAPIEVVAATVLLVKQTGISSIGPVALAIIISSISFFEVSKAIPEQKKWLAAVQERVSFIAGVLASMKGFKMIGMREFFIERIQDLRIKELNAYAHFRKFIAVRNALAAIPNVFGPPIVITTIAVLNGNANPSSSVAFTTLALVQLLTTPTQDLITTIPMFLNALVSLRRIEEFLLAEPLSNSKSSRASESGTDAQSSEMLPLESLQKSGITGLGAASAYVALQAIDVEAGAQRKRVLRDVDFSITAGNLALVIGPVGSGKSTLLKAIIGDVSFTSGARQVNPSHFGYCAQDSWLPNDTIRHVIANGSTVDQKWYERVTEACALTLDFGTFPAGDNTIVGSQGATTLSGGQRQRVSLARALYSKNPFIIADDILSGLDARTSQHVFDQVFGPKGLCKAEGLAAVLVTHTTKFLPHADEIVVLEEGRVVERGTFSQLASRNGYVSSLKVEEPTQAGLPQPPAAVVQPNNALLDDLEETMNSQTSDWAVYKYYFRSIGWLSGLSLLISAVLYAFGVKFAEFWVRLWADGSLGNPGIGVWAGVHFSLGVLAILSIFTLVWVMLIQVVPKSSAKLHKQLLCSVMRAPYLFFVNTHLGTTINRFATDMHMIESDLAFAFLQTIEGGSLVVASGILIASGSNYLGIAVPFIIVVLYSIQKFYLRTSRQMRLMDLEAQAPLLTQLQEALTGIATIRAFGWEHHSRNSFLNTVDRSQKPYYLLLCIQRWLNLVLDLVTAAIAITAVTLAVTVFGSSSPSSIGLALLNILSFSTQLTYLVTAWTQLETSLGAVARCKLFESDTALEDKPGEIEQPPASWPSSGKMVFENVTASYRENLEDVLKHVSFSIAAGEKVGICGRTGSGKSSLILTLLHMLDRRDGKILLDNVDLATIPRQTIRTRLTVIPQEPALFSGSVRENLDPLAQHSATTITECLQRVGLYQLIQPYGDLDAIVSDLAFSPGQMQLLAVARALLHKSKVLVLDEVTSSVDGTTEDTILRLVREDFSDSTVIAVAHRLATVMDFDKIVVMDKGEVVEVGRPGDLLEVEGGHFRAMCQSSGN